MKDKNLRICIIINTFPPEVGGAERYAAGLAEHLAALGHSILVLTRGSPSAPSKEIIGSVEIRRLSVPKVPGLRLFIFAIKVLKEFHLQRKSIDIIHSFQVFSPGLIGIILSKIYGKPVVIREGQSLDSLFMYKKPIIQSLFIYTVNSANTIYADHDSISQFITEIGAAPGLVKVIQNPVDSERFSPQGHDTKKDLGFEEKFVVLSLGRLEKFKGIENLIEAMSIVMDEILNAILIIVGEGPEKQKLENLAKDLKIRDRIIFYRSVPFEEVHTFFRAADIFIQPSITPELPNTLLQAMASATATVATDLVGSKELVENEKTALVVPSKNSRKIAEEIIRLYKEPDLRRRLGENARETVIKNLSWQTHCQNTLKIYYEVLKVR